MSTPELYSAERSHLNHKAYVDFAKATGHAAILINGGAATAVLAYLTKDKMDVQTAHALSLSLIGLAAGVCFGAMALLALTFSADWWQAHYAESLGMFDSDEGETEKKAVRWGKRSAICVCVSLGCFFVSSVGVALRIYAST